MLTNQQKRLRREYTEDNGIIFSEKTMNDKDIKLEYYGTIQDLYDYEINNYWERRLVIYGGN